MSHVMAVAEHEKSSKERAQPTMEEWAIVHHIERRRMRLDLRRSS